MDIKMINIGFGNMVSGQRVITIIGPDSAPIKRIVQDGRDKVLSALQPETIANRFATPEDDEDTAAEEKEEPNE